MPHVRGFARRAAVSGGTAAAAASPKARGKALRERVPRSAHQQPALAADRPDAVRAVEESNRDRVPELAPIRAGRMAASPFTFLRGAAGLMDRFVTHLPDGRTAYVTPLITALGDLSYTVIDGDGRRITGGWLYDAAERGVALEKVPFGCTHLIPGLVPVWFTPEDVEQLTALGAAAKAAFDA